MIIVRMLSLLCTLKHLNVEWNSSASLSLASKASLRCVSKTSLSSAAMYSLNDARRKSGVMLSSPNRHDVKNREKLSEGSNHLVTIYQDSCNSFPFRFLQVMPVKRSLPDNINFLSPTNCE